MLCASALYAYVCHSTPASPMRAMTPLATIPVGAKGDRVPAKAPLPAMIAIRNGEMPARPATAIAGGASSALESVYRPGPIVAMIKPRKKNMIGSSPAWPRQRPHGTPGHARQRAVALGDAEQQHDSDQGDEERRWKTLQNRLDRHTAQIDADQPRQRQRQHPTLMAVVQLSSDGEDERGNRNPSQVHRRFTCGSGAAFGFP